MGRIEPYKFEPPPSEIRLEDKKSAVKPKDTTQEIYQQRLKDLIDLLDLIAELCDYSEQPIDQEMKDVTLVFDPQNFPELHASMKRRFPSADPTKVTYEQYKDTFNLISDLVVNGVW